MASPRFTARMAGLCYLLMTLVGGLGVFARWTEQAGAATST